jgi:hypothetical protein
MTKLWVGGASVELDNAKAWAQWKPERVKLLMIAESARARLTGASYHPTRIGLRDSTHEQA